MGPNFADSARAVFDCILPTASSRTTTSSAASKPKLESAEEAAATTVEDTETTDTTTTGATTAPPRTTTVGIFKKGGVCPRVAVRFSSILKCPASHVLDDGAARALAESLARNLENAEPVAVVGLPKTLQVI